jgi:hypothetical protein
MFSGAFGRAALNTSAVAAGNRLHLQELPEMADSALDPGSRSLFNSVHAMPQDSALPAQPLTPG